jgi:RNA polymerase sigma-70 factor (ECF subfamily)
MAIVAPDHVDLGRDALLVERTQAGDLAAFDDLYRRYFPRLRRFCMRYLDDPADAEEVAQEALARAYRAIASLGGDRRFYPWLSVIAKRLCIDHYRRTSRLELHADVESELFEPAPEERLLAAADYAILEQALDRLNPRHRDVLQRREIEGWSYQRIADAYGVSLGTVEQLLHRARKSLRKSFFELDGERVPAAAGVPVLGWLARRWAHFWTSVQLKTSSAQPLLGSAGGGIAGLAIVVGAAGMGSGLFGGPTHAGTGLTARVPRAAAVEMSRSAPDAAGHAAPASPVSARGRTGGQLPQGRPAAAPPRISSSPGFQIGDGRGNDSAKATGPFDIFPAQPLTDVATLLGDTVREASP